VAAGAHCQYDGAGRFVAAQQAATYAAVVAALRRTLGGTGRVLDVGCGRGELLARLTAAGFDAVGCDADPECVARAAAHGRAVVCAAEALAPDALRAAGADGPFAAVTLCHVLEHLGDPADALRRAAALAPVVVAAVPNPWHAPYLWRGLLRLPLHAANPGHRQCWDWGHLRTLVEGPAGLRLAALATDTVAIPAPLWLRRGLSALGLLAPLERGPMRWLFPRFGRSIVATIRPA
jgi:SAM-dependent methyltransferase